MSNEEFFTYRRICQFVSACNGTPTVGRIAVSGWKLTVRFPTVNEADGFSSNIDFPGVEVFQDGTKVFLNHGTI
jgi:hypothetical protein